MEMHFLNKEIRQVLYRLGNQADRERSDDADIPEDESMLAITQDTGIYFNIMLKAMSARKILEIGTSTGYSTLWFSDAIKYAGGDTPRKSIITIERNPAKIKRAKKNFKDAEIAGIIEIRRGVAADVLKAMLADYRKAESAVPFDFVFIDADKENAINYFELVLPMVRTGGIIAADNITSPKSCVAEMARYSRYVKGRQGLESVTVPIGMGEEITIKLRP